MPTHDGVRVHDDQGCASVPPRVGEQQPKESIALADLGTVHGALEHRQLLTECQILERDRSVSTVDQREKSERNDERSQHESSWPAISHRINQGPRSGCGERQGELSRVVVEVDAVLAPRLAAID
jgi:hypothetical protein